MTNTPQTHWNSFFSTSSHPLSICSKWGIIFRTMGIYLIWSDTGQQKSQSWSKNSPRVNFVSRRSKSFRKKMDSLSFSGQPKMLLFWKPCLACWRRFCQAHRDACILRVMGAEANRWRSLYPSSPLSICLSHWCLFILWIDWSFYSPWEIMRLCQR